MTVHPTILDLNGYGQIEDYNIASMQPASCININVSQANICSWITISIGGWNHINIANIMSLVEGNLFPDSSNLGFAVSMEYIMAALNYYLSDVSGNPRMREDANHLTGCNF